MVDIVTRLGKGSPLTNAEVDANFTNLAEVSGVTGEPMGHEDRTTSTISFNASTRTFTIAPTASSFTVWCKGKKVVVSSAQTLVIPNTTGMHSIYYDANGTLSSKIGYFTFSTETPTAYVYWNATTGAAPYFGDERHGVVLDWQTHEYLHRTRGAVIANGFLASGYTLNSSATNAATQIAIESGTFFDEDMKIDIVSTATPTAGTYQQNLLFPAKIPVLHLQGTSWVMDAPTDFPFKQGTSRPQYNSVSGGVWSTADVGNNQHATTWILATNNLTYPVIAIIGQSATDNLGEAEAFSFADLTLTGFPSVEFRPLYKLIYKASDGYANSVNAQLVSIVDLRSISAVGSAANPATDHGNLSGLSDDDHPQYLSVDIVRGSLTAAVKASFLPSQTSNAGKFLQTDGTATSWAALTSGNVTTALGFTPYNATNPSGFITGITSGNVTTALGFTPYNATNPSGYVTAAGARGSISVTGAGSYDSATGVINIVGGVTSFNTRTGAITLSSSDVTTALGFTPYNSTNPNGYLTGITSTQVTTALGYTPYNSSNPSGYITGITSGMVTTALGFTPYNNSNPSGYITSSALSGYLTSATAASTYLPLAGGTLTGNLGVGANSPLTRLDTRIADAFSTVVSDTSLNNNTSTVARFSYTTDPGAGITAGTGVGIGLSAVPNRGEVFLVSTNPGTSKDESDFAVWTTTGGVSSENFRVRGNGNVGVGTTSPSQKLEVYQSNSSLNVAKLWHVSGNAIIINASYNYYDAYNHIFRSLSGTTTYATFDNAGNFGLGTTTPSGAAGLAFAINGGAAQTRIALKNSTTGDAAGDGFQILLDSGSSEVAFEQRENAGIRFITNNVEALRILNNQNVGIGTSSPSTALYVKRTSGNSGIYTDYNGTNIGRIEAASNGNLYIGLTTGSGDIAIGNTANATAVNLTSAGSFGIGTSSPASKFVVNGGTVNTTTYTSSEARIADGSIHAMKTVAGGVFEAFRAINADTTAGTTVRVLGAATSDPFNNGNGGKVFIDAVRTATNMDLVFSLNNASGAAPVERFRFYGSGAFNSVGAITQNGSQVLHAGNYNSYSPTLTGTGASGTWGISITGNAAGLTDNSAWMLSRGTVAEANIDTATANGFYSRTNTGEQQGLLVINPGGSLGIFQMYMLWQGGLQFRNKTDSATWNAWKTVLTSLNYNSYSPTLTGTGASGTWGISITGNAATATVSNTTKGVGLTDPSIGAGGLWVTSASGLNIARNGTSYIGLDAGNYSSYALPLSGGTVSGTVTANYFQGGGWGVHLNPSTAAIRGNGGYGGALALVDGSYGIALWSQVGTLHFGFGSNTAVTAKATMDTNGNFNVAGALTQASNQVLHAGNYTSYAAPASHTHSYLPLSGGTLTGALGVGDTTTASITDQTNYSSPLIIQRSSNAGKSAVVLRGSDNIGTAIEFGRSDAASHWGTYLEFLVHDNNTSQVTTGLSRKLRIDATTVTSLVNLQLGGNTLQLDQSGTRSWNVFPSSGGLSITSGDGAGFLNSTMSGGIRSPSFYDSNDTTYYVDPANGGFALRGGTSNRVTFFTNDSGFKVTNAEGTSVADVRLGAAWSAPGVYSSGALYLMSESAVYWKIANADKGYIDSSSNLYAYGSMRAPLFYDYNNTGYYIDPAATSSILALSISSGQKITLQDANHYLRYQSTGFSGITIDGPQLAGHQGGELATNNGGDNWSLRWNQNGDTFSRTSSRAPIFYDSNDTARYVDPASTSSLVGLTVTNTITGSVSGSSASTTGNAATATRFAAINTTASAVSNWNPGGLTYQAWGQSFQNTNISADTGDLTLWLRPSQYSGGGTEVNMYIDGDYYSGTGVARVLNASNYSSYALPLSGGTLTGNLAFPDSLATKIQYNGSNANGYTVGLASALSGGDALMKFVAGATGAGEFGFYNTSNLRLFINNAGNVTANVDFRAPIFYDSADTGYYLNANGTSNLGGLTLAANVSTGRSTYGSGTANLVLLSESTYGRATIDFRSGVNYPSDGAQIYYETATDLASGETSRLVIRCENDAADSILIRAGQIVYNSTTVDGGSQATGHIFQYGNADRMYIYSDNVTAVGSFRAPIFYDSNDTARYVDPTGTSTFVGLTVTNTITGSVSGTAAGSLALTGGTLSGTLSFNQPVGLGFANGQYIKDNGNGGLIINSGAAVNINGTSVTVNGQTAIHAGNYSSYALPIGGGTVTGNVLFSNSGTTKRGIQGTCGDNDMWFVGGGATASNSGFMEIATGDDGQTSGTYEPIYVSQYGPGDPLTGTLVRRGSLLDNNGNTTFPLNITAYSDERLKTNWRSMPDDYVTRLAQVKVGIYDRTDENNTTQVGVGAQSFQTLLPEAIVTAADDFGTLSVNYGGAALASAVELAKEVVDLRNRVAHLESLINKLLGD